MIKREVSHPKTDFPQRYWLPPKIKSKAGDQIFNAPGSIMDHGISHSKWGSWRSCQYLIFGYSWVTKLDAQMMRSKCVKCHHSFHCGTGSRLHRLKWSREREREDCCKSVRNRFGQSRQFQKPLETFHATLIYVWWFFFRFGRRMS